MSEETVNLVRTRQVEAIVSETVTYTVNKEEYQALIDEGNTASEALDELRSNGDVETKSYETEVVELLKEITESVELEDTEPKATSFYLP